MIRLRIEKFIETKTSFIEVKIYFIVDGNHLLCLRGVSNTNRTINKINLEPRRERASIKERNKDDNNNNRNNCLNKKQKTFFRQ